MTSGHLGTDLYIMFTYKTMCILSYLQYNLAFMKELGKYAPDTVHDNQLYTALN